METTIACIGAGNMGSALMKGAAAAGSVRIGFADADREKAERAAELSGGSVYPSNTGAAEKADFVFLAVKPQILGPVLEEIAPVLGKRAGAGRPPLLVSMAAGWGIAKIKALTGLETPVVRIMPNTPALISRGLIALAAPPEAQAYLETLKKILAGAGLVVRVDEKDLDAVTGLSGSGPAFVYQFIEALSDGGVLAGLSRDKARLFAAQTVLGAADMVLRSGKHPGELKDMVASPAGTTIAGIAALEHGAFRGTVISAVEAAWKRSLELG
ncbi:MAG: pyrroline-5-carboxylate reductase [Treponema sp.]|jgi:pyrroline-5-carboxylate reductase|nr:pyrroline-5-carboxylate reductase [Treponema sp.]